MNILRDCPIWQILMRNGYKVDGISFKFWLRMTWVKVQQCFCRNKEKIKEWFHSRFNSPVGVTIALILSTELLFIYATFQR